MTCNAEKIITLPKLFQHHGSSFYDTTAFVDITVKTERAEKLPINAKLIERILRSPIKCKVKFGRETSRVESVTM